VNRAKRGLLTLIMRDAFVLLGVPVDRKSLATATAEAIASVERRGAPIVFACANPHSLVTAQSDAAFRAALERASLVVIDGIGVSIMATLAGMEAAKRITGTDYFFAVMNALEKRGGGRVFFFGSSQAVLDRIAARMQREFPQLTLCGAVSPPFGSWSGEENAAMVARINAARPDVLWVGMTAPKQETWVDENRPALTAPVIGSIGAVFDFYAGTHHRAPQWMCDIGIEWLYRLVREPRRMWRRNFVSAPKFGALVLWRHVLPFGKRVA
jgi:N-acetylglucosaminyldiphosphoundecaprenol N-acetyl-beta-D-mannosaminyltransferase